MTPRVVCEIQCPSEADAITVRDAIAQKLATIVRLSSHLAIQRPFASDTIWRVIADVTCALKLDADAILADLESKWSSGSLRARMLAGSRASVHVCPHLAGGPSKPCQSAEFQWTERVKV